MQAEFESLSLSDSASEIVQELQAQCPPGKEAEFHELLLLIVPNLKVSGTEAEVEDVENEANNNEQELEKEAHNEDKNNEQDLEDEANDDEQDLEDDANNEEDESNKEENSSVSVSPSQSQPQSPVQSPQHPAKQELTDYLNEFFPVGATLSFPNSTTVSLQALKLNSANFWGVSWHSSWTLNEEDGSPSGGRVRVLAHYYEDGNVQLHAERTFSSSPSSTSLKEFIQQSEDSLQMDLNAAYQQLADVSFKRLRRQLPITRQKMDWTRFANYKLSSELKAENS